MEIKETNVFEVQAYGLKFIKINSGAYTLNSGTGSVNYVSMRFTLSEVKEWKKFFVELDESEVNAAEQFSSNYDINLDEAKILVLADKLKAKTLFVGEDVSTEALSQVKGAKILRTEISVPEDYKEIKKKVRSKKHKETMQDKIIDKID